jgi:hypothetical protein
MRHDASHSTSQKNSPRQTLTAACTLSPRRKILKPGASLTDKVRKKDAALHESAGNGPKQLMPQ